MPRLNLLSSCVGSPPSQPPWVVLSNIEKSPDRPRGLFPGDSRSCQIDDPSHWVIYNEQNCIQLPLLEADKSQVKGLAFDKGLILLHLMAKARRQESVKARGGHPALLFL